MAINAKGRIVRILVVVTALAALGNTLAFADKIKPAQPSVKDKCPVCGMFVYKYPDWQAQIVFKDGSSQFFDGAKDLFKYYFNIRKYSPGRTRKEIAAVFVMEYYDLESIDATKAFYVVGSDVYGPMGHELIPFAALEDARAFKDDHQGRKILPFDQVTLRMVKELDLGPSGWTTM